MPLVNLQDKPRSTPDVRTARLWTRRAARYARAHARRSRVRAPRAGH